MQDRDREVGLSAVWAGLILLLLLPSLFWIWIDRSVWPWDSAWYGEVSINLYLALRHSVGEWVRIVWTALPNRSPGLVWLGEFFVPAGISLGRAELGLRLCTWLVQAASACLLYRAAIKLFDNAVAAFTAVVFVVSAPLFVGMTHTYMTEPVQGLGVTLFLYFLCDTGRRPVLRTGLLLGIAFVCAMLGKVTSLLFVFCPAVLFFAVLLRRRSELRRVRIVRHDVLLAGVLAVLAAIFTCWLWLNYAGVVGHAMEASSGWASIYYGSRAGLSYKVPFWIRGVLMSFLDPLVRPLVAAGLLWALWSRARGKLSFAWKDYVALACAAEIVIVIIAYSFNVIEETRFTFSLFPCVGLVLAWIVDALPGAMARAFCGVALAQLVLIYSQAYGITAPSPSLSPYLLPVDTSGVHLSVLQAALVNTCVESADNKQFVVGLELPYFNANSLSFYSRIASIRSGIKCGYVNLGYFESDAERAWSNLLDRRPGGILFLESELSHIAPGDAFNRVSYSVCERARSSPAFRRQAVSGIPDLLLFRSRTSSGGWSVLSALFRPEVSVSADWRGGATWKIHPSLRRSGEQTVVQFDDELPARAMISGRIQSCNNRCQGVALEFETTGDRPVHQVVTLPAPVQGRTFTTTLDPQQGDSLLVRVRSLDPARDNVDYCWLTVADVRVQSAPK